MSDSSKKAPTVGERCGTLDGIYAHKKRGESNCRECKDAQNVYQKQWAAKNPENRKRQLKKASLQRQADPEKYQKQDRAWRLSHLEQARATDKRSRERHRAVTNERTRDWRKKNPEKAVKASRGWHSKYPERSKELHKAWMSSNPEKTLGANRVRRARKAGVSSEPYTVRQILDLYGTDCHLCDEPIDLKLPRQVGKEGWQLGLHLDHEIPLSKGGSDLIENVKPSHAICNMRKWSSLCLGLN